MSTSKADGSRIIPQFNLAQYLAENQDRVDGVAPFIALQFAEMKTAPPTAFKEFPKCVTLPDGQQFVARDAEHEQGALEAFKKAASSPQGAPASGGAGAPGSSGRA